MRVMLTISEIRTCHGRPGKSWNFVISFSRPGKSLILIVDHGKSLKITLMEKNR